MQLLATVKVHTFMKAHFLSALILTCALGLSQGPGPRNLGASPLDIGEAGIAWIPRLEDGLKEAKRLNKPILFYAVASQCSGIPGVF